MLSTILSLFFFFLYLFKQTTSVIVTPLVFPVTGSSTVNGHPLSANLSTNPNVNPPGSLQSIYAQMAQTPQINTQFLLLSTTLSLPQTQTQLRWNCAPLSHCLI